MSFDPTPENDDDDHRFGPAQYLPAVGADPAEQAESAEWDADVRARLATAVRDLDDRSRDIVQRRWLAENKPTLHELADEDGVSAERIRQIEVAAVRKLRHLMA
jgi:RNA polymerase sigma-32 factor